LILNTQELIEGPISRLQKVERWSSLILQWPDSVDGHTGIVCIYCTFLAMYAEANGQPYLHNADETMPVKIDWKGLMIRASLHDLEESMTGDIPRHFKYSDSKLSDAYKGAAMVAMSRIVDRLCFGTKQAEVILDAWKRAKDDGSLEAYILCIADFMSVLMVLWREHLGGNRAIRTEIAPLREYLNLFYDSKFNTWRSIIVELDIHFVKPLEQSCV